MEKTKNRNACEAIGEIIERTIKGERNFSEESQLCRLQKAWPEVAGELHNCARVAEYRQQTLFLETVSPAWAQQLVFYKTKIIEKFKLAFPKIKISDIKISSTGIISPIKIETKIEKLTPEEERSVLEFLQEEPEEIKTKLSKIVCKAKQAAKNDNRNHCVVCGLKLSGQNLVCFKCHDKKIKASDRVILDYLGEAPWSRFQDIAKDLPNIREEQYHQVKEKLIKETVDKLKKGLKLANTKEKKGLQQLAQRYTMLRTGLTPVKINDIILKECTGEKLYRALYSQSSKSGA